MTLLVVSHSVRQCGAQDEMIDYEMDTRATHVINYRSQK